MTKPAVVILAAGKGKRMRSSRPKVLHELLGRPIISYVYSLAVSLDPTQIIVVISESMEEVKQHIAEHFESSGVTTTFAYQTEPLGTGHALMAAVPMLQGFSGPVLVLSGDTPLLTEDTARALLLTYKENVAASILTTKPFDPRGYGRIVRQGKQIRIIEETDATPAQKETAEVNTGTYCFDSDALLNALPSLDKDNQQAEYYLTDVIGLLSSSAQEIVTVETADSDETTGINSRKQLAEATRILRFRINEGWLDAGVTIVEPDTTFIEPDVSIGNDTVVYPYTFLEGKTAIGHRCRIGPFSRIIGATIEDEAVVEHALVRDSVVGRGAQVGPFCSLRPGTKIGAGAKVGTFVEVKQSEVGKGSKIPHLSYIGDAAIGEDVNVGAGSITCNYDGYKKYQTIIKDGAFIGSDTMFVAPVTVGRRAVTGAGSVINQDVPEDSLAVERSVQKTIAQWAKRRRDRQSKKR